MSKIRYGYYREEFFKKFPKLEKIGSELFNTKLWLLLILHTQSLPQHQIASMRCKSIRDECPELSYLMNALLHLEKNDFLVKKLIDGDAVWRLKDTAAFEITKFKDEVEIQATQKGQHLLEFVKNCSNGEIVIDKQFLKNGNRWKDFFPSLLKESAKGTIRVMFALIFGV